MNWETWLEKVRALYNEAIQEVSENYMKQNFESNFMEITLLLEMHHLIKPKKFTLIINDEDGKT